ncbi:hypothetical protein JCM1840_000658 [Sporobolomyces johnsonii]
MTQELIDSLVDATEQQDIAGVGLALDKLADSGCSADAVDRKHSSKGYRALLAAVGATPFTTERQTITRMLLRSGADPASRCLRDSVTASRNTEALALLEDWQNRSRTSSLQGYSRRSPLVYSPIYPYWDDESLGTAPSRSSEVRARSPSPILRPIPSVAPNFQRYHPTSLAQRHPRNQRSPTPAQLSPQPNYSPPPPAGLPRRPLSPAQTPVRLHVSHLPAGTNGDDLLAFFRSFGIAGSNPACFPHFGFLDVPHLDADFALDQIDGAPLGDAFLRVALAQPPRRDSGIMCITLYGLPNSIDLPAVKYLIGNTVRGYFGIRVEHDAPPGEARATFNMRSMAAAKEAVARLDGLQVQGKTISAAWAAAGGGRTPTEPKYARKRRRGKRQHSPRGRSRSPGRRRRYRSPTPPPRYRSSTSPRRRPAVTPLPAPSNAHHFPYFPTPARDSYPVGRNYRTYAGPPPYAPPSRTPFPIYQDERNYERSYQHDYPTFQPPFHAASSHATTSRYPASAFSNSHYRYPPPPSSAYVTTESERTYAANWNESRVRYPPPYAAQGRWDERGDHRRSRGDRYGSSL